VLLFYLAISCTLNAPTLANPAHVIQGGYGDSSVALWDFNWFSFAILHLHNPLYSHFASAPTGANMLAQPESDPLMSIVMIPVTAIFGPIASYNLVATTAFGFAAFTTFVTLRQWLGGIAGPLTGGLIFGFSPYMQQQGTGHVGLTIVFLVPLIFLFLIDIMHLRRWSMRLDAIVLGVLLFLQLLINEEIIFGIAFGAVVVVAFFSIVELRRSDSVLASSLRGIGAALIIFIALAALPLGYQYLGPGHFSGVVHGFNHYVIDLLGPFLPTPGVAMFLPDHGAYATTWSWVDATPEIQSFIGPFLIIAGVAVARRWSNTFVRFAVVFAALFFVLSLGPSLHVAGVDLELWLPWRAIQTLPIIDNVLPSRLFLYVYLALAVLVAVGVSAIVQSRQRSWQIAGVLIVALSLASWWPAGELPSNAPQVPSFFTSALVKTIPAGSLVFLNASQDAGVGSWLPTVWQIESGMRFRFTGGEQYIPLANQTVSFSFGTPNVLTTAVQTIASGVPAVSFDPAQIAAMRSVLVTDLNASAVVVGPMGLGQRGVVQLLTTVIGAPPRMVGGVALWIPIDRKLSAEESGR
jgi:hypothetical protein